VRAARGLPLLLVCVWACAQGIDTSDELGGSNGSPGGPDASTDRGSGADVQSGVDTGGGDETGGQTETGSGTDTGGPTDSSMATDVITATDAGDTDSPTTGCAGHGFSGTLVAFDLTSQSGSETSAAATTSATGVTGGAISRASGLTAVSGSGSINSSGWGTGSSADPTKYYTFTVTPGAGCTLALTSLTLDVKASTTGPASGDVATSVDAFSTHLGAFSGTATPTVSLGVGGVTPIEIRVYGYGASSTGGTYRVENTLTLTGSIQ
jgi:hypothetical protein